MATLQAHYLPIDENYGFPQTIQYRIDDVLYKITLDFNSYDDNNVYVKIERASDGAICFNKKLPYKTAREVRDPETYELLFTIFCRENRKDYIVIWVFLNSSFEDIYGYAPG